MTTTAKADMFGIHQQPLLAELKQHVPTIARLEQGICVPVSPLLIQTDYMLLRTYADVKLLEKYSLNNEKQPLLAAHWHDFEAKMTLARLYVTNVLYECESGSLARKLITADHLYTVILNKRLLDIFGGIDDLEKLLFEAVEFHPQHPRPIKHSPVRISLKEGYTCGYVMAMQNVVEWAAR
jgi:hypothetical protein